MPAGGSAGSKSTRAHLLTFHVEPSTGARDCNRTMRADRSPGRYPAGVPVAAHRCTVAAGQGEGAARALTPTHLRCGQPEGRRGQDHHGRQPGSLPRPPRPSNARRRSRPPRQRDHRARARHQEHRALDVRRGHARAAPRRLRRADVGEAPVRRSGQPGSGRRRDRVGPGLQSGAPVEAGHRGDQGRLRVLPHRLSPVARAADRQRPGRRQRGAGPHPVRVLRPGGSGPAAPQRRSRPPQPQSRRWRCPPSCS